MTISSTAPLTGAELLSFVKKNPGMSKTDLAIATGYVGQKKGGQQRCNFARLQEALLEATGVVLGKPATARGRGGRKLTGIAKVQGNSNLLIGKAYTAQLGLEPGAQFVIKLYKATGRISLVPVGSEEEGDES